MGTITGEPTGESPKGHPGRSPGSGRGRRGQNPRGTHWPSCSLARRSPDCLLYGADHINTPVNGITAADYSAVLEQHAVDIERGELRPQRHTALPLRF